MNSKDGSLTKKYIKRFHFSFEHKCYEVTKYHNTVLSDSASHSTAVLYSHRGKYYCLNYLKSIVQALRIYYDSNHKYSFIPFFDRLRLHVSLRALALVYNQNEISNLR